MSKLKVIATRRWPDEVQTRLRDKFDAVLNRDDAAMTLLLMVAHHGS